MCYLSTRCLRISAADIRRPTNIGLSRGCHFLGGEEILKKPKSGNGSSTGGVRLLCLGG
jgi:hypothetical protein